MAELTKRKITTFRWICTNKELCEQLDEQIDRIVGAQSKLSSYVANKEITGLECLVVDSRFTHALKSLKDERKTLWRRVKRVEEEEVSSDVETGQNQASVGTTSTVSRLAMPVLQQSS